jgi:hypothetical protein
MMIVGLLLMAVGALLALFGFNMDTRVSAFVTGEVSNLSLMQQQELVVHSGLAAFVAGAVLCAVGTVDATIKRAFNSMKRQSKSRTATDG